MQAQKAEGWNLVLVKQAEEQERTIQVLRGQLEELVEKDCNDTKIQKVVASQGEQIKSYKQAIKALEVEISQIQSSWVSPEKYKADLSQLKDLQVSARQMKEEAARKRDLIATLKSQKENLEKQSTLLASEQQSLKEEVARLTKQIKGTHTAQQDKKQLKHELEQAKARYAEQATEFNILTDKVKYLKQELARKDSVI